MQLALGGQERNFRRVAVGQERTELEACLAPSFVSLGRLAGTVRLPVQLEASS